MDLASQTFDTFLPYQDFPKGQEHSVYGIKADSQNNLFFIDFASTWSGRIDAKTGKISLFKTPTPNSNPRRGYMDAQDRLWFTEYRANKIAMFDTRTEKFTEWALPTAYSYPYDVMPDKNGELWTAGMSTDRVTRLDPKTGAGHRISAAAHHQCPPCLRRQLDHAGDVLDRQQSRRLDREARAAGLESRLIPHDRR